MASAGPHTNLHLAPDKITKPAPHNSVFYRPDALPDAQPTASKHWRPNNNNNDHNKINFNVLVQCSCKENWTILFWHKSYQVSKSDIFVQLCEQVIHNLHKALLLLTIMQSNNTHRHNSYQPVYKWTWSLASCTKISWLLLLESWEMTGAKFVHVHIPFQMLPQEMKWAIFIWIYVPGNIMSSASLYQSNRPKSCWRSHKAQILGPLQVSIRGNDVISSV